MAAKQVEIGIVAMLPYLAGCVLPGTKLMAVLVLLSCVVSLDPSREGIDFTRMRSLDATGGQPCVELMDGHVSLVQDVTQSNFQVTPLAQVDGCQWAMGSSQRIVIMFDQSVR